MASSEHIKALVKSHLDNDDERFLSLALQVAAHEARSGHGKLAQELRDIVERAKKRSKLGNPVSIAKGISDTSGLLVASHPKNRLSDLVVSDKVRYQLDRVVREQRYMSRLKDHGLSPRRRVLLVGPPGTGKTYTASALAGELDSALFRRFDDVIRYSLPSEEQVKRIVKLRLTGHVQKGFPWSRVTSLCEGLSAAEIVRAADEAVKEVLIYGHEYVTFSMLKSALQDRQEMRKPE